MLERKMNCQEENQDFLTSLLNELTAVLRTRRMTATEIIVRLDALGPFWQVNTHMVPMNMSTENPTTSLVSRRGLPTSRKMRTIQNSFE